MKKTLLSLFLLFSILQVFAQEEKSKELSKEYHLRKSKNQKTTAFILLGTGSAVVVTSLLVLIKRNKNHESIDEYSWGPIFAAGVVTDLVSIPWFFTSAWHKKQAASIAIANQKNLWYQKNNVAFVTQPAIKITIRL
ncbi:MAG: hypothetical protein ABI416_06270 [Ginsengibacter sp.]